MELYIAHKHYQGFAFVNQGGHLKALARSLGNISLDHVETETVSAFLRNHGDASFRQNHARVTRFCEYWQARGEMLSFKMPPSRRYTRSAFTPYIYSTADIRSLLLSLRRPHRPDKSSIPAESFRAVLIFLYGTGATLKSLLAMKHSEVDLIRGQVTLGNSRGDLPRSIPINGNLVKALQRYVKWKTKKGFVDGPFFVSDKGKRLSAYPVGSRFRRLLAAAGCVRGDGISHRPRLHDLRATFAVHRITTWLKEGADLGRMLPALAAYMGQKDLTTAERFLMLTPERFRAELDKLSPRRRPFNQQK